MRLDPSTLVLAGLAVVFAVIAYLKDPSLPLIGAKNGVSMLAFILPRLVPALILAGLFQVVIPQDTVSRWFGREGGMRMGWHFVWVRVIPSLAFPIVAGWLVATFHQE